MKKCLIIVAVGVGLKEVEQVFVVGAEFILIVNVINVDLS
jgi:hypothetical protein